MNSQNCENKFNSRQFLVNELERRCRENPRYSLRAFAKALGVSPSALSLILAGRRGLSRELASEVSKKLGLDPLKEKSFIQNSLRRGKPISIDLANFNQLALDKFATIADWYHFAILSLIETKDFKPKIPWIASRLGISEGEARAAVDRLVRLEVLCIESPRWKQIGSPIFLANEESTSATKVHQRQDLEKAIWK